MKSVQCARAVASLLVVYFHAVLQLKKVFPNAGAEFVLFGDCGVDIFFVLSGFLMWRSTQNGQQSAIHFYKKRIARIVPLYWFLTSVAALIALAFPTLLMSTRYNTAHLIASLAFLPWPNPASLGGRMDLMSPVIVPGWTLNFEMMFYFVFGLGLIGSKENRKLRLVVLFVLLMVVVFELRAVSPLIAFYDPSLVLEFLFGVAIGVAVDDPRFVLRSVTAPTLVCAFVVLVALNTLSLPVTRMLSSGVPAAVIIYSLLSIDLAKRWPDFKLLVEIGDASFSIYLIHIFVLAGLRLIWVRVPADLDMMSQQALFVAMCMIVSSVAGVFTFRFVERPLGDLAHKALGLSHRASPISPPASAYTSGA